MHANIHICTYIYIYIHTHTHHNGAPDVWKLPDGSMVWQVLSFARLEGSNHVLFISFEVDGRMGSMSPRQVLHT